MDAWNYSEIVILFVTVSCGIVSALIGVIYRNLRGAMSANQEIVVTRLERINGTLCLHDGCLDDHEKRLIREEERAKAQREVVLRITREIEKIAKTIESISLNCVAMHAEVQRRNKLLDLDS